MSTNDLAIEISDFHKRYGDTYAVRGLDLNVRKGTFFGFVGPNGAGKSTTINTIVGLIQPSSGTIKVVGYDISKEPLKVKRNVGLMPEETVLYERLSAREYFEFVGQMYALPSKNIETRTKELLELLDLDPDKLMGTYSMGMKKKASLGAALIHEPQVIILDEPFSGIDASTSARIRTTLNNMVDNGHTVFFSSHVLETVEKVSRELGIIHKGKLLACGTLDSIRRDASCGENASLEEVFLKLVGAGRVVKE